jgi:hypothetical protein
MLVMAGMEVSAVAIAKAVEERMFQNLAGISSLQRISVYADDVVIFLRPDI